MTEKERQELEYDEQFGMTEAEVDHRFAEAVRIADEIAGIKGEPTCEYDYEKGMAYVLYPDGRREYPTLD